MTTVDLRRHLSQWRDWELNPIVIKELRQAVRSWAVTGMLLFFLAVLFIVAVTVLINSSLDSNISLAAGGDMFSAFTTILGIACVFFIPLYVGVRLALERQDNNPDLLYVTTLSPGTIIRGKFFSGAYMALLFFSVCMPFMAFSNLLRGVDLPTVFFFLGYLFLLVCAAIMAAIFLACLPFSRLLRTLLVGLGFVQSFFLLIPLISLGLNFRRAGVGAMMSSAHFWEHALLFTTLIAAIIGLFYILAVALITPPSANRALPIRLYLSGLWLLGGLLATGYSFHSSRPDLLMVWTAFSFAFSLLTLLVTISNTDRLSVRVRRSIPQSLATRLVAFAFYNGAAGGLLWLATLMALTFGLLFGGLSVLTSISTTAEDARSLLTLALYAFAYALTALFVHRTFLPRRPPKIAGFLTVLLAALVAIVPAVVLFFLNRLSWRSLEGLQLGNAFNVYSVGPAADKLSHLYFAGGWLGLMLLLNARWFYARWQDFTPSFHAPEGAIPPQIL